MLVSWVRPLLPHALVTALCLLLIGCGSGSNVVKSGGGESGVGGTGISLVKGNVTNIDGIVQGSAEFSKTTVSVGSSSAQLDPSGNFILGGVSAADKIMLDFTNTGGTRVTLDVGAVTRGATVEVIGVQISYVAGTVSAARIQITPANNAEDEPAATTPTVGQASAATESSPEPVTAGGGGGENSANHSNDAASEDEDIVTSPPEVTSAEQPDPPAPPVPAADVPPGDNGSSGSGGKLNGIPEWLYEDNQSRRAQREGSKKEDEQE